MFNYTNIDSAKFEKLALLYLQNRYPGSKWEPTKRSWDGNKDIQCKYTFFDQTMEYWAEAKFTPNPNKRNLQKSQLDPTLVSAFLNKNPVTINFISNNNISENYIYRLTDFRIKTNIGITLILKEEFEQWLLKNPDICEQYHLQKNATFYQKNEPKGCRIKQCLIAEEDSDNAQYSFTKFLNYRTAYFLYLNIYSDTVYSDCSLISDTFKFINRSSILTNAKEFSINIGWNGYKFEFLADKIFAGDVNLTVRQNIKELNKYKISDVKIIENHSMIVSYAKQERALIDISNYIQESGEENNIVEISGGGATGKSHLLKLVQQDLESRFDIFHAKFSNNNAYNAECLCRFLIYLNLGKLWEFSLELVSEELKKNVNPMQYLLYENLISGLQGKAEEVIEYIYKQMNSQDFNLLFPTNISIRKVSILDDIHKLSIKHLKVVQCILNQYGQYDCSQTLILASRRHILNNINEFSDKLYSVDLYGLSKYDKDATLKFYLKDDFDITYNRATDDVLIFSNIICSLLDDESEVETISKNVKVIREMTNPQITNLNIYKTILKAYNRYNQLIELVYYINSGIEFDILCNYFNEEEISFLIQERIFKKVRGLIYPFHDLLVQAYFEINKVSRNTIKSIKELIKNNDYSNNIYYLSLILNSDYGNDYFNDARHLRDSYYQRGDLFPAYQISQGLVNSINFDEKITDEEVKDFFIFAETSMYENSHDVIRKIYDKVIKHSRKYLKKNDFLAGLLLRSSIEKINMQFWDFQTEKIFDNIEHVQTTLSEIPFKSKDIDFTYIHCFNRSMVTQLLMNQNEKAEDSFHLCVSEAERLNYPAHIGFAYMDFGRGIYSIDIERSISYLEKAFKIFESIQTEQRRQIECEAEILYAKCIFSPSTKSLLQLEELSNLLFSKHYFELYAKVKLKVAALKIVYDLSDCQDIQEDIFQAEYAMKYQPSVRYQLILLSVKSVYYIKTNEIKTAQKLNNKCIKLSSNIGSHYQKIYAHNNQNMLGKKIKFMMNDELSDFAYYLTPYLW